MSPRRKKPDKPRRLGGDDSIFGLGSSDSLTCGRPLESRVGGQASYDPCGAFSILGRGEGRAIDGVRRIVRGKPLAFGRCAFEKLPSESVDDGPRVLGDSNAVSGSFKPAALDQLPRQAHVPTIVGYRVE